LGGLGGLGGLVRTESDGESRTAAAGASLSSSRRAVNLGLGEAKSRAGAKMLSGLAPAAVGNDALRGLSSVVDSAGGDETLSSSLTAEVNGTAAGSDVTFPSASPESGVGGLIWIDGVGIQLAFCSTPACSLPIPASINLAGAS
jgi:hypothetical protein